MPIRIRCRDKSLGRQYSIENQGIETSSLTDPMASYTDRNLALCILCGSV
jgi:hypothetical protein